MLKKVVILFTLLVMNVFVYSNEHQLIKLTKDYALKYNKNIIVRTVDTEMPQLKTTSFNVKTRIRKVTIDTTQLYFYELYKGKRLIVTVEYNDIIEGLKAFDKLKRDYSNDIKTTPMYLDNEFITIYDTHIGYIVRKKHNYWYMRTEFVRKCPRIIYSDLNIIEKSFNDAKTVIENMKLEK